MSTPDSELQFDDTACFICGRKLPETSDPTNPAFDGYCDQDCVEGKNGVNSVSALAFKLGWSDEGGIPECFLARRIFKDTECGATFTVHKDLAGVSVSGYVEGLDAECPEHEFQFPFHIDDFNKTLDQCDVDAIKLEAEYND